MARKRRVIFVLLVTLVLVALDQATKLVAIAHLKGGRVMAFPRSWYPNDLFRFSYAYPLNAYDGNDRYYGDELERFQFSIGQAF